MYTHETTIYYAILITAVTIGGIIAYLMLLLQKQQRKNAESKLRSFTAEINLLEQDRSRVSRDLHDEIGSLLSLAQGHINELDTGDGIDHAEEATRVLSEMRQRLAAIAKNLSPRQLEKKGLRHTLEHFFEDTRLAWGLDIVFIYEAADIRDTDRAIHLYRIVLELTQNAVKHAKARTLTIHFKDKNGRLFLYCKDDGVGFEAGETKKQETGSGLKNLESRTGLLQGKITFTSKPKHGTEYFFEFPG